MIRRLLVLLLVLFFSFAALPGQAICSAPGSFTLLVASLPSSSLPSSSLLVSSWLADGVTAIEPKIEVGLRHRFSNGTVNVVDSSSANLSSNDKLNVYGGDAQAESGAVNAQNPTSAEKDSNSSTSAPNTVQPNDTHAPNGENGGSCLVRPVKYWGNSFSGKFHRPSCAFAQAMNARHVLFFHFRCEAVAAGEQPCRYCLPPYVKHVQCKILPKSELLKAKTDTALTNNSENVTAGAARKEDAVGLGN
jgi:hypothetical protein